VQPAAERKWTTVRGHRLSYQVAGPADAPPIVLLHGLASDSDTWEYAIPELAERGLRVFALDLLGHGASDKPYVGYLLDDFAAEVDEFMAIVGLPSATLCGHSLGGAIAMHVAYHYPARVQRLVLVAAGGLGREVHFGLRAGALPGAPRVLGAVMTPRMKRLYATRTLHRMLRLTPEQVRNLSRMGRTFGDERGRHAFFTALRGVIRPGGQSGSYLEAQYLSETMPTLVVWSEQDVIIPVSHARATHEHLPHSKLVIFPGGGHEPHRRHAVPFAQAVAEFIDELPSSQNMGSAS
jgi:pimeloyl-ACP methyl ester carboxylesterase